MELLPGDSEPCTIIETADIDLTGATVAWSLDGGDTWVGATWAAAATYDAKTLTWSRPSQVTLSRSPASAGTVVTRDVYPVLTRVTIGATVLIRPGTARIRLPDVTPPPRPPIPGRGVPGGLAGLDSAGDVIDATGMKIKATRALTIPYEITGAVTTTNTTYADVSWDRTYLRITDYSAPLSVRLRVSLINTAPDPHTVWARLVTDAGAPVAGGELSAAAMTQWVITTMESGDLKSVVTDGLYRVQVKTDAGGNGGVVWAGLVVAP